MAESPPRRPAPTSPPIFVLLGGPNGAGKTTAAPRLLKGALRVSEFLNADLIARGLSPFAPEGAALAAGDVLLRRMDALSATKVSFAMESTPAPKSLPSRIRDLVRDGYEFHLVFLHLPSADLAVERVAARVRLGGHAIPEHDIRRRYVAGLHNFFRLYRPLADSWQFYDSSASEGPRLIASGGRVDSEHVTRRGPWTRIRREYDA